MKLTKAVNYISVCPKCDVIPSILMIPNDKDKIFINCSCGYKDTIKIKEYILFLGSLFKTEKKKKGFVYQGEKCKKHNREYQYYCVECNSQLCRQFLILKHFKLNRRLNIE